MMGKIFLSMNFIIMLRRSFEFRKPSRQSVKDRIFSELDLIDVTCMSKFDSVLMMRKLLSWQSKRHNYLEAIENHRYSLPWARLVSALIISSCNKENPSAIYVISRWDRTASKMKLPNLFIAIEIVRNRQLFFFQFHDNKAGIEWP